MDDLGRCFERERERDFTFLGCRAKDYSLGRGLDWI